MRVLACIGDATSIYAWSSIPFFFLEDGKRHKFLEQGWKLAPEKLRYHRWVWNAWRALAYGQTGGFQYSAGFLHQLHKQIDASKDVTEILSHFPLFPPIKVAKAPISYYLDATLVQ